MKTEYYSGVEFREKEHKARRAEVEAAKILGFQYIPREMELLKRIKGTPAEKKYMRSSLIKKMMCIDRLQAKGWF